MKRSKVFYNLFFNFRKEDYYYKRFILGSASGFLVSSVVDLKYHNTEYIVMDIFHSFMVGVSFGVLSGIGLSIWPVFGSMYLVKYKNQIQL